MDKLNFSWLIEGEIAGHSAPMSDADLDYLRGKGIRALVRMAEIHKTKVTPNQIEARGMSDCHEPPNLLPSPIHGAAHGDGEFVARLKWLRQESGKCILLGRVGEIQPHGLAAANAWTASYVTEAASR